MSDDERLTDHELRAMGETLSGISSDIAASARGYDLVVLQLRSRDTGGNGPQLKLRHTVRAPGSREPRSEAEVWLPLYRRLSRHDTASEEQMTLDTLKAVWIQLIEPWLFSHGVRSDDEYAWMTGVNFMAMDWRR
jgi:hypothetical protein